MWGDKINEIKPTTTNINKETYKHTVSYILMLGLKVCGRSGSLRLEGVMKTRLPLHIIIMSHMNISDMPST